MVGLCISSGSFCWPSNFWSKKLKCKNLFQCSVLDLHQLSAKQKNFVLNLYYLSVNIQMYYIYIYIDIFLLFIRRMWPWAVIHQSTHSFVIFFILFRIYLKLSVLDITLLLPCWGLDCLKPNCLIPVHVFTSTSLPVPVHETLTSSNQLFLSHPF